MSAPSSKDRWDKADIVAKAVGAVSIPVLALFGVLIVQAEGDRNRNAQLFAQVMSQREQADGQIRAAMFKALLERYGSDAKANAHDAGYFQDRITFLSLLLDNFQEYFDARAMLESLYRELREGEGRFADHSEWLALRADLFRAAEAVAGGQASLLGRVGDLQHFIVQAGERRRIPLYDTAGLEGMGGVFPAYTQLGRNGAHRPEGGRRYSIEMTVEEILDDSVNMRIAVFEDRYEKQRYQDSEYLQAFPLNVSYFDTPYMNNKRLATGERFAIVLERSREADGQDDARRQITVVTFGEQFLSLRDRPYFEEMIHKINSNN
jgi:hypothetical protein